MERNVLNAFIQSSEKAANIARACRQNAHLFELLVQEKIDDEKNPRFVHDFKTLADVLIQETIKHDIGEQFPELAQHIKGEESNTFQNTLGESITVEVKADKDSTAVLLSKVLNGDAVAADLLADEVHKVVPLEDVNLADSTLPHKVDLPVEHLGVWIDPIDATSEYIRGKETRSSVNGLYNGGLQCVTVLLGVYDRTTGRPVMGVINQPFFTQYGDRWIGRCMWGISHNDTNINCIPKPNLSPREKVVLVGSGETEEVREKLRASGAAVVRGVAGAGHKLAGVALGLADAYVLTRPTTFLWDTCAPHALLLSQGGGVASCANPGTQLTYAGDGGTCNEGGIVAYRDPAFLEVLLDHELQESVAPSDPRASGDPQQ